MIQTNNDALILMATYNGQRYIKDQIESLLSQTYTAWDLLIYDDGSTDKTVELLREYEKKYAAKIKVHVNLPGTGSAKKNFFKLIKECALSYKYYFFADQDDIWFDEKISQSIQAIKDRSSIIPVAAYSDLIVVNEELTNISNSFFEYCAIPNPIEFSQSLLQNNVTGCTVVVNKKMILELRKLINENDIYMHDWLIALIAKSFGELIYLDPPQILYRQHSMNSVGASKLSIFNITMVKKIMKNTKKTTNSLCNQARQFEVVYSDNLTPQQKSLLEDFIKLKNANILTRVRILNKNKLFKSGLFRKVKQIILG